MLLIDFHPPTAHRKRAQMAAAAASLFTLQGLADALFGQGKAQEAKTVMRAAGLVRKDVKQQLPARYLRWLNTRVARYMDSKADDGDDLEVEEGEGGAADFEQGGKASRQAHFA